MIQYVIGLQSNCTRKNVQENDAIKEEGSKTVKGEKGKLKSREQKHEMDV